MLPSVVQRFATDLPVRVFPSVWKLLSFLRLPSLDGAPGSKLTADGDCSHEIKRHLLLGRKIMTHLDSILKSRDIICQQKSV